MYKLLVVDDEFNIRDGIANAIAWNTIDVQIVGTAIDGVAALEKVETLSPDIIITDVSMDDMDGLELSSIVKTKYPDIKIVILSGYEEFEYVQKALELKVHSYIMKPIRSIELIETIKNVIVEIKKEKELKQKINSMELEIDKTKSLLVERFLFNLVHGNIVSADEFHAQAEFLDIKFTRQYYTCLLVTIPEHYKISKDAGIKKIQSLVYGIREIIFNIMNQLEVRAITDELGSMAFIVGNNSQSEKDFHSIITSQLELAMETITRLLQIKAVFAVGAVYKTPYEISKSFKEASLASEHNLMTGEAMIVHINDITSTFGTPCTYPIEKESLLLKSLSEVNIEKTNSIITEMFIEIKNQHYTKSRIKTDIMGLISVLSRKTMDMDVDVYQLFDENLHDPYTALDQYNTIEQIENWVKNIAEKTIYEIKNKQSNSTKSVIKKANKYLEDNYMDPSLSLVTISEHLCLSASYFSRLYKKESGVNYVEVLTKIRIGKAKEMLKKTNQKISTISELVGYTNSKYFCTIFKKSMGITPVEYRET